MNWKIADHYENTKEIHIEIWVSLFFVLDSVGQKQGDYMKNRFEIQGNCLTVYRVNTHIGYDHLSFAICC